MPNLLVGQDLPELADLDIDPEHIAFVQDAMWSVCEEPGGTAYRANGLGIKGLDMAGKTGTGQVRGFPLQSVYPACVSMKNCRGSFATILFLSDMRLITRRALRWAVLSSMAGLALNARHLSLGLS